MTKNHIMHIFYYNGKATDFVLLYVTEEETFNMLRIIIYLFFYVVFLKTDMPTIL